MKDLLVLAFSSTDDIKMVRYLLFWNVFYLSYSAFLYKWLNLKHVILVILVVLTEEFDRSNSVGTSKSVPCAALAAAAAACCCLCCLAFFITLKL